MTRPRRSTIQPVVSPYRRWVRGTALAGPLLIAGLLGFVVLASGPGADVLDSDVLAATPLPPIAPAADPGDEDESDVEAVDEEVAVLRTFEIVLSRDPFAPVVPEDQPDPPSNDNNNDAAPAPTDPTDPSDPADPGNSTDPTNNDDPDRKCIGQEELICEGKVVTLDSIQGTGDDQRALIQVDDIVYSVQPGDRFASSFELLRIDGECVVVAYGDEVQRLCLGETVLK